MEMLSLNDLVDKFRNVYNETFDRRQLFLKVFYEIIKKNKTVDLKSKTDVESFETMGDGDRLDVVSKLCQKISSLDSERESWRKVLSTWTQSGFYASVSLPEKISIYKICVLLRFKMEDCNKLLSVVGYQNSNYCGNLTESLLHHAIKTGKDYSWVRSEYEKILSDGSKENGKETRNESFDNITLRVRKELGSDCDDDKFCRVMKKMSHDFIKSSSNVLLVANKILNVLDRNQIVAFWSNGMYNDSLLGVSNKTLNNKYIAIRNNNMSSIPTREYILIIAITEFFLKEKINNENLLLHVNQYLKVCSYDFVSKDTLFDKFVFELSNYSFNGEKLLYNQKEVSFDSLTFNVGKKDSFVAKRVKIMNTVIKMYNAICNGKLFDGVVLQKNRIQHL